MTPPLLILSGFGVHQIHPNPYPLKLSHTSDVMELLIKSHAPLNHGSEVSWALWTDIVLGLTVSEASANAASKMNDSVVAILLLDVHSKGLVHSPVDFSNYQSHMVKSDLYDDQWLLCYEANVKNWLSPSGTTDHVSSDKCFSVLKRASVSFYDDKWATKNKPRKITKRKPTAPGGGGGERY